MMLTLIRVLGVSGFLSVLATSAFAFNSACMAGRQVMPINNQQVIAWKTNPSFPNAFKARANVEGVVWGILKDRNGHDHFIIQIGPNSSTDMLEVVYNQDFGGLPAIQKGMQVHACGDFIKSIAQTGPYPPSPAGAIVHWVHINPNGGGHEHGYLAIDNVMYGIQPDQSRPNPGQRRRH
jgi:hypothetical protein